jgi:hypothetical protein
MPKITIYLSKSEKKDKKWKVLIDKKTVHFGAQGMSDYTIHKDPERMKRYLNRHSGMHENWTKQGLKTAGFWSRWLLWNKPSLEGSRKDMEKRFNISIKKSWPKSQSTKSPAKRKSKSPAKRKSKSPAKRKSKSPAKRKSKSPAKRKSKSPAKMKSKSPAKRKSKSPAKRKSKSPAKRKSKSPAKRKTSAKYERCVQAVKAKQHKYCFSKNKWIGGDGCYNPWQICTKKVGRYG